MSGVIRRKRPPDAGYRVYLAERERLGFPSRPGIDQPCPWCGADPFTRCRVRATGKLLREPHEARVLEAS
jgi:hypothetical protein